jgi:hypothetical protein
MQIVSKKIGFVLGFLMIFGPNGAFSAESHPQGADSAQKPRTYTYEDEMRHIPLKIFLQDLKIKRPDETVKLPKNVQLIADVWSLIIKHIPLEDLAAASLVCKEWHAAFRFAIYNTVMNIYVGGSSNPFPSRYPLSIGYRFWKERPQGKFGSLIELPTLHPLFNPHYTESMAAEAQKKTDYRVARLAPSPTFETIQAQLTSFFISQAFQQSRVLSYLLSLDYLGGNPVFLRNSNLNYLCLDHTALMKPLEKVEAGINIRITTLSFVSYRKLGNIKPEEMLMNLLSWVSQMALLETLDISCLILPGNHHEKVKESAAKLKYFRRAKTI